MRLPASITAQPPDAPDPSHQAATHVDPTTVSDVDAESSAAERKPWWARVTGAIVGSALTNVAAALIAVTGAVYVGMYHAPWVKRMADHTPTAAQAGDAVGVAVAAAPASAATPSTSATSTTAASREPAAQPESPPPALAPSPATPDRVAAARDRMEQRIYSQVPTRARTVAENETMNDDAPKAMKRGPAPSKARRYHRGTRRVAQGSPANAAWYKGA